MSNAIDGASKKPFQYFDLSWSNKIQGDGWRNTAAKVVKVLEYFVEFLLLLPKACYNVYIFCVRPNVASGNAPLHPIASPRQPSVDIAPLNAPPPSQSEEPLQTPKPSLQPVVAIRGSAQGPKSYLDSTLFTEKGYATKLRNSTIEQIRSLGFKKSNKEQKAERNNLTYNMLNRHRKELVDYEACMADLEKARNSSYLESGPAEARLELRETFFCLSADVKGDWESAATLCPNICIVKMVKRNEPTRIRWLESLSMLSLRGAKAYASLGQYEMAGRWMSNFKVIESQMIEEGLIGEDERINYSNSEILKRAESQPQFLEGLQKYVDPCKRDLRGDERLFDLLSFVAEASISLNDHTGNSENSPRKKFQPQAVSVISAPMEPAKTYSKFKLFQDKTLVKGIGLDISLLTQKKERIYNILKYYKNELINQDAYWADLKVIEIPFEKSLEKKASETRLELREIFSCLSAEREDWESVTKLCPLLYTWKIHSRKSEDADLLQSLCVLSFQNAEAYASLGHYKIAGAWMSNFNGLKGLMKREPIKVIPFDLGRLEKFESEREYQEGLKSFDSLMIQQEIDRDNFEEREEALFDEFSEILTRDCLILNGITQEPLADLFKMSFDGR